MAKFLSCTFFNVHCKRGSNSLHIFYMEWENSLNLWWVVENRFNLFCHFYHISTNLHFAFVIFFLKKWSRILISSDLFWRRMDLVYSMISLIWFCSINEWFYWDVEDLVFVLEAWLTLAPFPIFRFLSFLLTIIKWALDCWIAWATDWCFVLSWALCYVSAFWILWLLLLDFAIHYDVHRGNIRDWQSVAFTTPLWRQIFVNQAKKRTDVFIFCFGFVFESR